MVNILQICALADIALTQFFREEIPIQNIIVRVTALCVCSIIMANNDNTPKLIPISTHFRFHASLFTIFTTFTAPGPFQTLQKQDNSVTIFTVIAPALMVGLRYMGGPGTGNLPENQPGTLWGNPWKNPWGRFILLFLSLSTTAATLLLNAMTDQFFTSSRILAVLTGLGVYAIMAKGGVM
jgi:hypothetical protein